MTYYVAVTLSISVVILPFAFCIIDEICTARMIEKLKKEWSK